jgi:hypothetical protein
MRNVARTLLIGSLAVAATAFAGVSANQGGLGAATTNNGGTDPLSIRERFEQAFPGGALLENGTHLRRVWGRQFSWGNTPDESVTAFMKKWSDLWGVPFTQLMPVGPFRDGSHILPLGGTEEGNPDFTAVYWSQQVRGVPVFRSYVWGLVGNEDNFPMVLAGGTLKNLGNFPASMADRDLSTANLEVTAYGSDAMGQFESAPEITSPRYVVWAGVDAETVEPKLGIEFVATSGENGGDPANYQKMQYVVDADTGVVLYQESLINQGTATAQINAISTPGTKASACTAATTVAMPYAKATIGGTTYYADATGKLTYTYSGTSPQTIAPTMGGRYFTVIDNKTALLTVPSQSVADGATGTFSYNTASNQFYLSEVNTYIAANRVRDLVLAASPSFPTIATQTSMPINNGVSGTCNAFYNGSSINFYSSGGGCNNTGFSSVTWHEYGHHVVSCGGSGQNQYGEGMGDCIAVLMSGESQLGLGFTSCGSALRNASNSCVGTATSSTCGTAIHSWGQVLSGCVWDTAQLFKAAYPSDYLTRMANLTIRSVPLHAGQSDIWTDITVDFLTLDDAVSNGGNNNIGDGSPNYSRIATGFGNHGLTAPALSLFTITAPSAPSTINPAGGDTIDVTITPVTGTAQSGSQKMFVSVGTSGSFTGYAMTNIGGNNWRGTFPAADCNATVQYYFEVKNTSGTAVTSPSTAPASAYSTKALTPGGTAALASENFESTDGGFVVTGSPASGSGGWEWSLTSGHGCNAPSTAGKSFITGVRAPSGGFCNELDGGPTILTTPTYDLAGVPAAEVTFQTYYFVTSGVTNDPLVVKVSNNGGTSWVTMASYNTTGSWTARTLNVGDYVSLTNSVKFRFEAADTSTDNALVCGIDNFAVNTITCTVAVEGDLDGDSLVGASDIAILLLDFGPCPGTPCPSDLDGDGDVSAGDIAFLLLLF